MADKTPIIMVATQIANRANGGIESFTQLASRLRTFRPIIVTNVDGPRTGQWRHFGIETHVVSEQASGRGFTSAPMAHAEAYWRYARTVRTLAARTDTRLLYANDPLAMQFVFPLVKLGGLRATFAIRNMPDPGIRQSPRKFAALMNACSRMLFLSNDMKARWEDFCGPLKVPASVTYSIVDEGLLGNERRRERDRPFVLIPARITPPKRQLEFIRHTAPGLAAAGLRILFAGDASASDADYQADCRKAAEPLGDAVEFLGFQEDLRPLYARASAVVVAARLEGLARAMIEGLASGCPVVSFDVCSAHEILDGGAGVVAPSGDWRAMEQAIRGVCGDPIRLEKMERSARETALRLFNGNDVIERYEQALEQMAR